MKIAAKNIVAPTFRSIAARLAAIDWPKLTAELDARGALSSNSCSRRSSATRSRRSIPTTRDFRSRIVMARHGFGRGEYKYFCLSAAGHDRGIARRRSTRRSRRSPIAGTRRWASTCAIPPTHADFVERCHAAGQTRPTPLLLQYGAGDYNCLHQDLYGEHVFPLQVAILLSEPGRDFTGGEFVLTEQRPRMQSRAEVVPLARAMPWCSRCITGRCRERAGPIASTCATASAAPLRPPSYRSASFSTMRNEMRTAGDSD